MSLQHYSVPQDKFHLDGKCLPIGGLDFPCNMCQHRDSDASLLLAKGGLSSG